MGGTGRSVSHGGSGEGQSRLLRLLPDARSGSTPLWHPPARPCARCLDVIKEYEQYIKRPDMGIPGTNYLMVEANTLGESWAPRSSKDWYDLAVEKRLSQLRLLPKREILEEAVQARIAGLQRQEKLGCFHLSPLYWEHVAKPEIVQMLIHIFMDALQDDGNAAVDNETMTKLAVVAEGYAQKLWDGEYKPSKDAASQKSSPKKK